MLEHLISNMMAPTDCFHIKTIINADHITNKGRHNASVDMSSMQKPSYSNDMGCRNFFESGNGGFTDDAGSQFRNHEQIHI